MPVTDATQDPVWPSGAATGIGSMPGEDITAGTATAFDVVPDLPFAPEFPARGPGSDMVGRAAGRLVDMYVDLQPSGWRLVPKRGIDWRRTKDLWARDLDALELHAGDYAGPLKIQLCGPWTLAANVEMANGHKALRDEGARRDVAESLGEGAAVLIADIVQRVPGAKVILQLDEPSLPQVLAGQIKTPSGFGRIDAVDPIEVRARLAELIDHVGVPVVVHCCAPSTPVELISKAGAVAVALDLSLVGESAYDELAESMDRGLGLFAGAIATDVQPNRATVDDAAREVRQLAGALGLPLESRASQIVVTPACGLAGSTPDQASEQLRAAQVIAKQLADNPDNEDRR